MPCFSKGLEVQGSKVQGLKVQGSKVQGSKVKEHQYAYQSKAGLILAGDGQILKGIRSSEIKGSGIKSKRASICIPK
jgi:hypothetical protein